MDDITELSVLLRRARVEAGLSQRAIAERAGTTQAVIARIESGDAAPTLDTVRRIAAAAGLDLQISLVPKPVSDPAIDAYKPGVDQTLNIENLRRSPDQRMRGLAQMAAMVVEVAAAGGHKRPRPTDYRRLILALAKRNVDFIVTGGCAAILHGSARFTESVDVIYSRTAENIKRVCAALQSVRPWPRGAIREIPFAWSPAAIRRGLNIPLSTEAGFITLLGDQVGGGTFEALTSHAPRVQLFSGNVRVLDLPTLIKTKRAAGRWQDFHAIAELEILQELGRNAEFGPPK